MTKCSYEEHESDEDRAWFLKNMRDANPRFVDQMKEEFKTTADDESWDWIEMNKATKFLPDFVINDPTQMRQEFVELVMNNLFPGETWD